MKVCLQVFSSGYTSSVVRYYDLNFAKLGFDSENGEIRWKMSHERLVKKNGDRKADESPRYDIVLNGNYETLRAE